MYVSLKGLSCDHLYSINCGAFVSSLVPIVKLPFVILLIHKCAVSFVPTLGAVPCSVWSCSVCDSED